MASSDHVDGQEKGVLELAKDRDEPPQYYVQKEGDRPSDSSLPSSPIPTIDLQLLFSSGPSMDKELEKLRSSLDRWGFFQVINHGIPSSLLDEIFSVGKEFFHIPKQERQRYTEQAYGKIEDSLHSIPENLPQDQIHDWNDILYLLTMPEDERKIDDWPLNPSSFRDTLHEYSVKMKGVINPVLRAVAILLGLEENYFVRLLGDKAAAYARFNYYPPCSRPDLVLGIKSHSDGSVFTFLLQDQHVDGLEVLEDKQWVRVLPTRDAILINVGDQMEIMSNGIWKSPVHRVVTNGEMERMSIAMFLSNEGEKEIGPADGLVSPRGPKLYKTVKVKDYLDLYAQNFFQGKRTIDYAKV